MTYKSITEIHINYFHNYFFVHKLRKYVVSEEIKQIICVPYELYAILLNGL